MGEEARVFAQELAKFKFGHALWWPEHTKDPNGEDHDIEIGDVGYIDGDGAFHVLFNVTHNSDHVLSASHALNNIFTPLKYDRHSVETKERFRTPEYPVCGSTITEHKISAQLAANSPLPDVGGSVSFQFRCHSEQGAFLMLWDDATKTVVQKQELRFIRYMRRYHSNWYLYAREVLGLSCRPEDIILVRGFIKTSSWTVAAFLGGGSQSREITLHGQLGPTISVGCGYTSHENSTSSPMHQRSGPAHRMVSRMEANTEVPPARLALPSTNDDLSHGEKDQCVFLNYFKILYRAKFLKTIIAAADPPDDNRDGTEDDELPKLESDYDVEVETECSVHSPRDPIDILLEYILEVSDASIAIASYNDLERFPLDDRWPETFRDLLRFSSPPIMVDEESVGRLAIVGSDDALYSSAEYEPQPAGANGLLPNVLAPTEDHITEQSHHLVGRKGHSPPSSITLSPTLCSQVPQVAQSHSQRRDRISSQPPLNYSQSTILGDITRRKSFIPVGRLPYEIVDLIKNNIPRDAATLKACSFVCREWLSYCHCHLFSVLRVRDSQVQTSPPFRHVIQNRFEAFLTFITTVASPGFCAKVHTLCLLGNEERYERQAFISADMLAAILGQLPRVRILELYRVNFTPLAAKQDRSLISLPSGKIKTKLEVLSLGYVNLSNHSPDGLFSVLGLFSTVDMLRVSYLETPRTLPSPSELQRFLHQLQIRRLSLKGHASMMPSGTMPYMLDALLGSDSVRTLETLEIKCSTMDEIQALGRLLRETGSHLRSLALDIADVARFQSMEDYKSMLDDVLRLEACTGMLELRIQIFPNEEDPASNSWLDASHVLCRLLSYVTPTLATITIVLQYYDVLLKNCSTADWEALNYFGKECAGWKRFTHLTAVKFALMPRCMDRSVEYEARVYITKQLPHLERRGLLKFTTTGFWEDRENVIADYNEGRFL